LGLDRAAPAPFHFDASGARAAGGADAAHRVLGVTAANDPQSSRRAMVLEQGLEKLGWTIGRNLHVDYRWGCQ
jgi:hypothetical protein